NLNCWLVRRLIPLTDPHLVLGVIAEGASLVLDRYGLARSGLKDEQVRALVKDTADQMLSDATRLRGGESPPNLTGKTVILVDDGITAGGTLAAAIEGVRRRFASKIVIASPVGCEAAVASLAADVHECMCLMLPPKLRRVGAWFQDYRPVTDSMVMKILS